MERKGFTMKMALDTPAVPSGGLRAKTGLDVYKRQTQERLNKAKEFLAQTNIHLYDVCYKVGYLSPCLIYTPRCV